MLYEVITLNSWKGAPADELTASWGPPHEQFRDDDGRKVYQWSFREIGENASAAGFHYQAKGPEKKPYCHTRFYIDDADRIEGWAFV